MIRRLHIKRVVWTSLRAGFTADAAATVEIDNAVLSRKQGRDRTDLHARSVGAMIAPHYRKKAPRIRETSLFNILYPRTINADRNLMFGFAGNGARVAADALSVIDNEAKIHNGAKSKVYLIVQFPATFPLIIVADFCHKPDQ
jgi:hypothetical protein